MWILSLDSALDAAAGGKAQGLGALRAAGLPVPEGFVLTDDAFRAMVGEAGAPLDPSLGGSLDHLGHALAELAAAIEAARPPAELAVAVAERLAALDGLGRLAVRSSISLEDRGAGAAAGVFSSKLSVSPEHVWPAIRAVWASVCTPLAAAYARHRQRGAEARRPLSVAVIIQRYIPGERLTIYTRPPGQPRAATAWLERAGALQKLPRDAAAPSSIPIPDPSPDQAPIDRDARALELALRAERALDLAQGADVELIESTTGELFVVQARPIVHPPAAAKLAAPPLLVSALVADGRRWTADFAHNPDPLSTAQAALIELIEREQASPYALRLCAGYLYSAPRESTIAPAPARSLTSRQLYEDFAAVEQRAAAALGEPTPYDLPATLAAYLRFYRVWAFEMSPLVSAGRRAGVAQRADAATAAADAATAAAAATTPSRPVRRFGVESMIAACARGELTEAQLFALVGELAPAWDVAVPTLAETPERLAAAISRARARAAEAPAPAYTRSPAYAESPAPSPQLTSDRARLGYAFDDADPLAPYAPALAAVHSIDVPLEDLAAELAEIDDLWFARAQARVRQALLARGLALSIGEDVFWLPLEEILTPTLDPESTRSRAAAARNAHRRATAWRMPPVVGGDLPPSPRWRGVGTGGAVSGRVVHIHNLWEPPVLPLGAIAVTPAVTPALAVALLGAAAIVSETGGLLDHGAAIARELGIPCVVGCADAMSLPLHAMVLVDGDAGSVTELEPT